MLTKSLSFLAIGFLVSSCYAQDNLETKYVKEITPELASKHLHIIASDEFQGRETGTEGNNKAAAYIAGEFKKLGLSAPVNGSYFLPVPIVETKFTVNQFKIGSQSLNSGTDFAILGSQNDLSIQANEIIFVGYGISDEKYDDLAGLDISNKVVLVVNEGEPTDQNGHSRLTGTKDQSDWSTDRSKRIQNLIDKKPKLILATSSQVPGFLERVKRYSNGSRMLLKEDYEESTRSGDIEPTVAYITPDIANAILSKTNHTYQYLLEKINQSGQPATQNILTLVQLAASNQVKDVKAQNVLGFMEGTDLKEEILVVTAHYDHIGVNPDGQINNGADDDGSGVTGVLEIATAFAKAKAEGHGPRRSILFMTVTGEEKGLLGSDYYTKHPVFPLAQTITDLNIDMIGRIDPPHEDAPNYVYLVGSDKLSSTLHQISEKANSTYTKLDLDYKYNDPNDPERIYYRSDHYNFAKNKIPVIFYFNGVHEDYHSVGDKVEKINFDMLSKRAQLVFYTAWELANRDQRPIVDSNKK